MESIVAESAFSESKAAPVAFFIPRLHEDKQIAIASARILSEFFILFFGLINCKYLIINTLN